MTFAAVMFVDCVAVWAAAAVLADVTVWNDVVELPADALAAVVLTSLARVAVAACFAVEPVRGSAAELVHVSVESAGMNAVKVFAVHV